MLRQDLLAALDAVDHRRDLGTVLNDDIPLAADLLGQVLAGQLAGLSIVGLDGGVRAGGGDIDRDDDDPGLLRPLDGGEDCPWIGRIEQNEVHSCGDEVVHLAELLVQIVVGRSRRHLNVRVDLLGLRLGPFCHGDEERVPERSQCQAD